MDTIGSRVSLLEATVKSQQDAIDGIKKNQKEYLDLIFDKIDLIKSDIHQVSLSSKDIIINQQKESLKSKMWMTGILVGFVSQAAIGILLIFLQNNGQ